MRLRYLRKSTRAGLPRLPDRRRGAGNGPRWPGSAALFVLLPSGYRSSANPPAAPVAASPAEASAPPDVWLVDRQGGQEIYSNGLRIEGAPAEGTHRRRYLALPRDPGGTARWMHEPAGIVFHSSESRMVDFSEEQTTRLKLVGRSLVEYVREEQAYHFVIDRFGRVFRTVEETDAAFHAGRSVWADGEWIYINLNESFLGVAFEAQSGAAAGGPVLTAAQVHAGRVLTDMLRARYKIAAVNCVTHAQVSVNPRNLRVGYHSDWADSFPFAPLGLPANYALPLASVALFGFEVDAPLKGTGVGEGMLAAQLEIQRESRRLRRPESEHRAALRERWRQAVRALEQTVPPREEKGL
jgi:hypothetical protein